jgi:HEPN domain-containing protein
LSRIGPVDRALWPAPALPVVSEWVGKAFEDLEIMEQLGTVGGHYDGICFHAQQAVEKFIKGALIARSLAPPFTHDLIELSKLLAATEPSWSWPRADLRLLTMGAVHFRYPGAAASAQIAADAIDAARRIVTAIRALY